MHTAPVLRLTVALSVGFAVYIAVGSMLLVVGPQFAPVGAPIHYQVVIGIMAGVVAMAAVYRRLALRGSRA